MKAVNVTFARPIQVLSNGASTGSKWAKIVDTQTKQVLHTGQVRYIKRIAKQKYNHKVSL